MELYELQKQIVENNLDKLYSFTGEEYGIMEIYLDQICKIGNYELIRVDTVQGAYQNMVKRRMSGTNRCYVVRDDKNYIKEDKLWATVKQVANSSNDMLITIYTSIDKRSKYWKQNKKEIIVFEKLSPEILEQYIDKELPGMTKRERILLANICECNYSRILLECDKIKHHSKANGIKHGDSLNILIEQEAIYQPIGDITFKFTDAIATRDYTSTAKYLHQAKAKQEPEIMVLSILYNTFKQILLVQGLGPNRTNAASRTGLTGWQVNMAIQKMGHYTIGELVRALKTIRWVEKGIKTGQIDANISLEYLIVNIL